MKLVIGLGNPGIEYEFTRHNMGFMFLDFFSAKHNFFINKKKFNGLYNKVKINNIDVIFLKPQSYMNLSGEVVKSFVDYFKIDISDILVISDDLDLDVGKFRLKQKGSSGGHNGLKNISLNLGTDNFKRLKIGISNEKDIDTKDYVLQRFDSNLKECYNSLSLIVNNIIEDFLVEDFEKLMSKYNRK